MSVYKRKTGIWFVQFQMDGKTHIQSTHQKNKRTAELIEAKMKSDLINHTYLGILVDISLEDATKNYLISKKHLGSIVGITNHMVLCKEYLNPKAKVSRITNQHISKMLLQLQERFKPATCKIVFRSFFSMMIFTADQGYKTPKLKPPIIKIPKKKTTFISKVQEKALLDHLNPKNRRGSGTKGVGPQDNYDLTTILFDTGCRINEAFKLEWSRIDLTKRTIRLWRSKVGNETTLHMTDRVYEVLQRRYKKSKYELVFAGRNGQLREHSPVALRHAMDNVGLEDFTIHSIRHCFASRLVMAGVSLVKVAHVLGHSDTKTTEIYAHLSPDQTAEEVCGVINDINTNEGVI